MTVPWTSITGTPTTLAGYGITDAYTKTASDARYLQLAGGTLTGALVLPAANTPTSPALTFAGDLTTGIYWRGAFDISFALNGKRSVHFQYQTPTGGYDNVALNIGTAQDITVTSNHTYTASIRGTTVNATGDVAATFINIGQFHVTSLDQVTKTSQWSTIEHDLTYFNAGAGAVTFNDVTNSTFRPGVPTTGVTLLNSKGIDFIMPDSDGTQTGTTANLKLVNIPVMSGGTNMYGIFFDGMPNGGGIATAAGVDLAVAPATGAVRVQGASGGTMPARYGQTVDGRADTAMNMWFDGSNYNLDDTGQPGVLWEATTSSAFQIRVASAGPNPVAPTSVFGIDAAGDVTVGGLTYTFPGTQSASTALTTDGSGNLSWAQYPPLISTNKTYVVAPSGGDFTSIQAALAALSNVVIAATATVTIQVNDGTYISASTILVDGIFAKNIQIVGQHTYSLSVTSVQSSSGSAGAWSVVLNVSSVANVAANDYVVISAPTGGTLPSYIAGVFKITNVDGVNTRITVASTHRAATAPSGAVAATATVIKTILAFSGCNGFEIWSGGSVLFLDKVVVVGDGTSGHNGISLQDVGRLFVPTVLGVVGFGGGNVYVNYNAEFNSDGLLASSGAGTDGFIIDSGGMFDAPTAIASGNGANGVNAVGAFWRTGTSSISTGNAQSGFLSQKGSQVIATNPTSAGNTQWGFLTASQGLIWRTGATANNNGSGNFSDGMVTSALTVSGIASATSAAANINGSYTTAAGFTRGLWVEPTQVASANGDALWGIQVGAVFTPGAFTGVEVRSLVLQSFSVASFTSPADPKMMTTGALTATGATNAYGILLGAVTGATNNYLLATSPVSTFNVTAAGKVTAGGGLVSTFLDSGSAVDLLLKRNGTTLLTVGASTVTIGGALTTAAPAGGTAGAWKGGVLVTAGVTPDTTRYIQLDVGGTLYKLIVST